MDQDPRPSPPRKQRTGDPGLAFDTARRAAAGSPAYAALLKDKGLLDKVLDGSCAFDELPVTDKDSYCLAAPAGSLVPPALRSEVNGFFASSGSSGKPFCWPRLKAPPHSLSLPAWLEETFSVSAKKTLAVVALNMDGWTAGMNTALALNQFALEAPFPFMAAFPGADYAQALRLIGEAAAFADQVVVFIYPVAIPYFLRLAEEAGPAFPRNKLRFASTGDPFSEAFRERLDGLCGAAWPDTALASYSYSSADTRVIGTESRASRALARLLLKDENLRRAFGLEGEPPNLYITVPPGELQLTEALGGELLFTRWQAVPLVRYNLHDKGEIWDWAETRRLVLEAALPGELRPLQEEFRRLEKAPGDIIALYGRSRSLYFYGLHLDEQALAGVMKRPELARLGPGLFQVALAGDPLAPRLDWDIELPAPAAPGLDAELYRALVAALAETYPHFGVNYKNFLNNWDGDPDKRIFRFNFHAYPALSEKMRAGRKHRVIRGPAAGGEPEL